MNILDEIIRDKQEALARVKRKLPMKKLISKTKKKDFEFSKALLSSNKTHIIAEIKRSSPSAGLICKDFDPVKIALDYQNAGVSAISVLTEEKHFGGSIEVLQSVASTVSIPVLRKDFIFDGYQIYEAAYFGASAVLLIARILSKKEVVWLKSMADRLGIDCLIEVHDEADFEKIADCNPVIIGINNRDLDTLKIDLSVTERLISNIPRKVLVVSESGMRSIVDINRIKACGVNNFLIGEHILKSDNMAEFIKSLAS